MKIIQTSGKRKMAIAKATTRPGKGIVKINNVPLELVEPKYVRLKISEAIILSGDVGKTIDIKVDVVGGGIMGQADAVRIAICRGIIAYTGKEETKSKYLAYDRQLLVADVRRKEAAKPNRHGKARAKVQKSYR